MRNAKGQFVKGNTSAADRRCGKTGKFISNAEVQHRIDIDRIMNVKFERLGKSWDRRAANAQAVNDAIETNASDEDFETMLARMLADAKAKPIDPRFTLGVNGLGLSGAEMRALADAQNAELDAAIGVGEFRIEDEGMITDPIDPDQRTDGEKVDDWALSGMVARDDRDAREIEELHQWTELDWKQMGLEVSLIEEEIDAHESGDLAGEDPADTAFLDQRDRTCSGWDLTMEASTTSPGWFSGEWDDDGEDEPATPLMRAVAAVLIVGSIGLVLWAVHALVGLIGSFL